MNEYKDGWLKLGEYFKLNQSIYHWRQPATVRGQIQRRNLEEINQANIWNKLKDKTNKDLFIELKMLILLAASSPKLILRFSVCVEINSSIED